MFQRTVKGDVLEITIPKFRFHRLIGIIWQLDIDNVIIINIRNIAGVLRSVPHLKHVKALGEKQDQLPYCYDFFLGHHHYKITKSCQWVPHILG